MQFSMNGQFQRLEDAPAGSLALVSFGRPSGRHGLVASWGEQRVLISLDEEDRWTHTENIQGEDAFVYSQVILKASASPSVLSFADVQTPGDLVATSNGGFALVFKAINQRKVFLDLGTYEVRQSVERIVGVIKSWRLIQVGTIPTDEPLELFEYHRE